MSEAVVVGSGPNGLAGAVALAREGVEVTVLEAADRIGGGTRTSELTVPGLLHDECSASHPMAVGSPFLRSLDLAKHGLEWLWPEVDLAHPLEGEQPGVMVKGIAETAAGLGDDGRRWTRLFGSSAANFDAINEDALRPIVHFPKHPVRLARFGIPAATPATIVARGFKTPQGRALFGGVAAHAFSPLNRPMSSSVGCALIAACHAYGWPVAKGGSRSITDALAAELTAYGGKIETGVQVSSMSDFDNPDAILFDLAPGAVAEIAGDRLPGRIASAYRGYKHGPGAFKLDLAVEGGVPWRDEVCKRAGTVHLGGPFEEIAAAERAVNSGKMADRPFVLVGQQYLADPSRSNGDVHPVWTYAHVPSGYKGDATEAILGQLERFAPGVRERIVGQATRDPAGFEHYNANFVGGDIITGANGPLQILFRPRFAVNPYATGIPGVYICSAATPPGAGAHGMGGYNAARSALAHLAQ